MMRATTAWCAAAVVSAAGLGACVCAAPEGAPEGVLDPAQESPGLKVGDRVPEGVMLDMEGREVTLASLHAEGPVVLTFYRGGWCPHCTKSLEGWERVVDVLEREGARVVFISPENPDDGDQTQREHGPSLEILCDERGEVARGFRVAFAFSGAQQETYKGYGVDLSRRNASGRWELPAPATFVIDREGVIRWVFADWDYTKRADPEAALAAVREARKS